MEPLTLPSLTADDAVTEFDVHMVNRVLFME